MRMDGVRSLLLNTVCDMCVFTESWLGQRVGDDSIAVSGFRFTRADRGSRGGGIIIYLRNGLAFERLVVNSVTRTDLCAVWLPQHCLLLVAVYHPYFNSTCEENTTVIAELSAFISSTFVSRAKCDVTICGDINGLHNSACLQQFCESFNLISVVDFATCGRKRLDVILTSQAQHYMRPRKLPPVDKSDHVVVHWRPKQQRPNHVSIAHVVYDYAPTRRAAFADMMRDTDWLSFADDDVALDMTTELVLATIKSLHDYCFPTRMIRCSDHDKPWMSASIKLLIRRRDNAYRHGKMRQFKHYRGKVRRLIAAAKARMVNGANNLSVKSSWTTFKSLLGVSKNDRVSSQFSADEFATFFASVFQQDGGAISLPADLPSSVPVISQEEVFLGLSRLRKNAGADGFLVWVFRLFVDQLAPIVTYVFNRSLATGCFPAIFKVARVIPIAKVSAPGQPSDYRGISLLSPIGKLLEAIVLRHWITPLCTNDLFDDQFAFVPLAGRGTTVALTLIVGCILRHLDNPGIARAVLVDLSKAFDLALPSHCVNALAAAGAPFELLYWVYDYMRHRTMFVQLSSDKSAPFAVSSGVPQGSVLGPVIFAFLLATYKPVIPGLIVVKYADDVTLISLCRRHEDDMSQYACDDLYRWADSRGMRVNASKTKIIDFASTTKFHLGCVKDPTGAALPSVTKAKVLGVTFMANLKWSDHISDVSMRASRCLYAVLQLRRCGVSAPILWRIYCALARSIMCYAYPSFCNVPTSLFSVLQRVEKRAAKMIGQPTETNILEFCEQQCRSLYGKVAADSRHPLRKLFDEPPQRARRDPQVLSAPAAKTERLHSSFIRFSR